MRSLLAIALVLLPQEAARTKPAAPPVGSGAHVTSTLTNTLAIRFTADGKVLRKFDQSVKEESDLTIDVVASLAQGLDEEQAKELATPDLPPPFTRVRYGRCVVTVAGPDSADKGTVRESDEHQTKFYVARAAPVPAVHFLHGDRTVKEEVAERVRADADAFVVGPRFAPLVLGREGRELAVGATLDVPADVVAPFAALAVTDGTVVKSQLTFRGNGREGATEVLAFAVTLVVGWKGGDELPVTATFELAGELKLVKETAQLFALDLAGPIRYGGTSDENGAKLEITGTGDLTFTYRADPLAAK